MILKIYNTKNKIKVLKGEKFMFPSNKEDVFKLEFKKGDILELKPIEPVKAIIEIYYSLRAEDTINSLKVNLLQIKAYCDKYCDKFEIQDYEVVNYQPLCLNDEFSIKISNLFSKIFNKKNIYTLKNKENVPSLSDMYIFITYQLKK